MGLGRGLQRIPFCDDQGLQDLDLLQVVGAALKEWGEGTQICNMAKISVWHSPWKRSCPCPGAGIQCQRSCEGECVSPAVFMSFFCPHITPDTTEQLEDSWDSDGGEGDRGCSVSLSPELPTGSSGEMCGC